MQIDVESDIGQSELLQVADAVAREKGIDRDTVLEAMEQAISHAGKRKYGQEHDIRATIDRTNGKGVADFDRAMLEAMPFTTVETMTPWTDGVARFEGPLARDLMKRVGARGSRVRAIAINDYAVDIPMEDFERYPVILAMKMNGGVLHTRSKGPLWVIYPWSERPELRNEVVYGRSIWQIKELVIKK